jgi:ABC-type lipoprotein export system ATPase subunit
MNDLAVEVRDLHKTYRLGRVDLHVLRGVSLRVRCGEFVSVVGASGSGKSTLLHLIGLLDRPDKGHVILHGADAAGMRSRQRNRVRCRDVGFVFQFYHLLAELNVLDNTLLPGKVDSSVIGWFARRSGLRKRAAEILARLGLQERLRHRPKELSGGERQRVAIARALMNRPKLLLADEPTGNLDSKTGKQIMDVLKQVNRETGQTILLVTHDALLAEQTDRILRLRDGKLDG